MKDRTIIIIGRMLCGTAILITSQVCHVDGTLLGISLFLLGIPIEQTKKEE